MTDTEAAPKTPEAGEPKKVDEDPKTPNGGSPRRSHRSSSGRHRERRSGERREHRSGDRERRSGERREHRSSGDRDRRSGDRDRRSGDRREHRSGERRSGERRSGDDRSHRSRRSKRDRQSSDQSVRSAGGGRRPSDGLSRSEQNSERDREAKIQARRSATHSSPAKPGAMSVTDSAGSRRERDKIAGSHRSSASGGGSLPSAPLTKEERRSRRAQEEQDAKRRAKEGRSSGSRPGSMTASRGSRDQEAKRRANAGRSRVVAPGAQMASSRGGEEEIRKQKMQTQGGRPGASSSKAADHKKSLDQVRLEHDKSSQPAPADEPVAAPAGNEEVAVEAVAIDEEAEENERMRVLEEQNRALAERMERLIHNPQQPVPNNGEEELNNQREKEAEEARIAEEKARKRKRSKKLCILVFLLLAAGGGLAGYFLSQKSDAPKVSAPTVTGPVGPPEETSPPTVPPVVATEAPTFSSEGPSSSPTIDMYDPPNVQDCIRIRGGLPVEGQEDLLSSPFRVAFDIEIVDPELPTETWVPAFKSGIDDVLIPALAGCPISRRLEEIDQTLRSESRLRKTTTSQLEQSFERVLQEVDSDIRYVIANAKSSINPNRDVTDECEIQRIGCRNVRVILELYLKGEEKGFALITLIAQVLQALVDLDRNGNRQLELDEVQRDHRHLLVGIFGLDPTMFRGIGYRTVVNMDPTTSPSVSPSQIPSTVPTAKPSMAPSGAPSPAPSTLAPTGNPTKRPTPGPTPEPTPGPTREPTPEPTPGPTPRPTPGPTRDPTPRPTPGPTPQPYVPQTPQPFVYSTQYPTFGDDDWNDGWNTPQPTSPYGYPGCVDDFSFRDFGNDPCDWYIGADSQGCPNTGHYEGTCGTMAPCSAMTACCICNGDGPGCVDDDTYRDNAGDPCQWYRDNDTAGCPAHGTTYGGTCAINLYACNAWQSCCYCYQ